MSFTFLSIDWHIVRVGLVILGMGVFTVIIETIVMVIFRFDRFRRSLVDSVMANIGSLLLSILLFLVFNKTEFTISQVFELILLYCIISIFEAWLIRLLNAKMPWPRILLTSFAMNLISFASLYLIFTKFLSEFFA